MKKILFTFSFSLFTFISVAQNYEWRPIIPGIDCDDSIYVSCRVRNFTVDTVQDMLWMTGVFDGAAGIASPNAIGFDGSNFIAFPGVMDSLRGATLNDAIFYNGDLIICRENLVEKFSFSSLLWTTIGIGTGGVLCFGIYNGDLIAGGRFNMIDGVFAPLIARWNGAQWYSLGNGLIGSSHSVNDVEVYNGNLYAGGAYDFADDTVNAWNIAQWDGINWNNLCSNGGSYGTDRLNGNHDGAEIMDMEVFNNKLYITGQFEKVCGINCYLAYWDDTTWHGTNYPLSEGYLIKSINNKLVIESPTNPYLFYYNGVSISGVDTAFAGGENDVAVFQNTLYGGGGFSYSGATPVFRIARLMDVGNGIDEIENASVIKVYPNPANETVTITANNIKEIVVTNLLGEIVQSFKYKVQSNTATIDISKLPQGIYLLRFQTNNGWRVGKVVKE